MINKNDYVASPIREGVDPIFGDYIEEAITFTPTHAHLCNDFGLSSVCKTGDYCGPFNLFDQVTLCMLKE